MTIDNKHFTISEVLELQGVFGGVNTQKTNAVEHAIGKYVICRSVNEGVNAGFLVAADGTGCHLKDARRLKTHMPVEGAWYESVALTGLNYNESVVSATAPEKFIIENYSLTVCTEEAAKSIQGMPSYVP